MAENEHAAENDAPSKCRYMEAAYPSLTGDESCSEHEHNAPTFALARALAAAIQEAEPTDEQIGWAIDDAAAIIEDFDPAPLTWNVTKPQVSHQAGVDFTFEVNGVDYIVQSSGDGEVQHPIAREEWESWFEDDEPVGCDHDWLDRPESDTHVCRACGEASTSSPPTWRVSERTGMTENDALHFVTIECEPTGCWPTLKFTCQAPPGSECRTICPNSDCEEGCYHFGEPGHEREAVDYCNNVEWFENSDDVAGDIFGGPTSITAPIDVSWDRGADGPLWRFATASRFATVARVAALAEHWRANASRFSDDPGEVETWRDAALLLQEALDDHADHAAWPRAIPPADCHACRVLACEIEGNTAEPHTCVIPPGKGEAL